MNMHAPASFPGESSALRLEFSLKASQGGIEGMSELDSLSAGASRREFFRNVVGARTGVAVASGKGLGPTFSAAQDADVDSVVSFPSIRELHTFRQRLPHGQ